MVIIWDLLQLQFRKWHSMKWVGGREHNRIEMNVSHRLSRRDNEWMEQQRKKNCANTSVHSTHTHCNFDWIWKDTKSVLQQEKKKNRQTQKRLWYTNFNLVTLVFCWLCSRVLCTEDWIQLTGFTVFINKQIHHLFLKSL